MAVVQGERADVRLLAASVAVVVAQVVHGLTPSGTENEGNAGLVGGLMLLVASLAAVYGLRLGRVWGRPLAGLVGVAVAAGFVAYHGAPWHSPITNPYLGEGVGLLPWLTVLAAVASGAWAGYEAFVRRLVRL